MHKRRIVKDDGRYLIFYSFAPAAEPSEPDKQQDADGRDLLGTGDSPTQADGLRGSDNLV